MSYTLTLTGTPLDPSFSGTLEELQQAILAGITATIDSDALITGQVGGTAPITNVGPWLNGSTWYAWTQQRTSATGTSVNGSKTYTSSVAIFSPNDIGKPITGTNIPISTIVASYTSPTSITMSNAATGAGSSLSFTVGTSGYYPATIQFGNATNQITLIGAATAPRAITLQDKDGVLALLSDVYTPRSTIYPTLNTPPTPTVIDWSLSNSFGLPLDKNVKLSMSNSVPGQEIFVAGFNDSTLTYTIDWSDTGVRWVGVAPVQSPANTTASVSFNDGVSNSTTTYTSDTAAFTASDTGKTITGTNIPVSTTITYVNATTITLSNAATGTGTGLDFTIVSRANVPRTDIYILRNVGGQIYGKALQNYAA